MAEGVCSTRNVALACFLETGLASLHFLQCGRVVRDLDPSQILLACWHERESGTSRVATMRAVFILVYIFRH